MCPATVPARQGFSLKELKDGTEIEIDDQYCGSSSDEDYDLGEEGNLQSDGELCKNFQNLYAGSHEAKPILDVSKLTLAELKSRMVPVTEDKLLLKLIIREGHGSVIPAKAVVRIHYNASCEGAEEPYDSTYRRKKPHRFLINTGRVVPGLDTGVGTMRTGEIAKFWVHFTKAYGEMGCPPRIPESANILYEVEVINYLDSKEAIEFEEMPSGEQRYASFSMVLEVTKAEHNLGNEYFKKQEYASAISQYQRATRLLEEVSAENEEEDKKRNARLLKLYLNLSICNLKLKRKRCLFFSRKAMNLDEDNVKALFRHGQGLMLDNDFAEARRYLMRAQQLEPSNEEIAMAFVKLDAKEKHEKNREKNFCIGMFGGNSKTNEGDLTLDESDEFTKQMKDNLIKFKESGDKEYLVPSDYDEKQREIVQLLARSENLFLVDKVFGNQRILKVLKMNT